MNPAQYRFTESYSRPALEVAGSIPAAAKR